MKSRIGDTISGRPLRDCPAHCLYRGFITVFKLESVDNADGILSSMIILQLSFPLRSQSMQTKRSKCASTGEFIQA